MDRLLIAVLHCNENADREQAMNRVGTPNYHITFPKSKEGRTTLSKVLTACTFGKFNILFLFIEKDVEKTIIKNYFVCIHKTYFDNFIISGLMEPYIVCQLGTTTTG